MAKTKKKFPIKRVTFVSILLAASIFITAAEALHLQAVPTWQQIFETLHLAPKTNATRPSVHFIDVGQGDAVLLRSGNHSALIDAGTNADGGQHIVNYLKANGVTRLDLCVVTHAHADHIGGMDMAVMNFKVGKFIYNDSDVSENIDKNTQLDLKKALKNRDVAVTKPKAGDSYTVGDFTVTILYEDAEAENENNRSVITMVECYEKKFLLTGDAEKEAEAALVSSGVSLKCDVLMAGHHGSATANSEELLSAAAPKTIVYSCGNFNEFGHPSVEVCERADKLSITQMRTDVMGDIVFYIDKESELEYETGK